MSVNPQHLHESWARATEVVQQVRAQGAKPGCLSPVSGPPYSSFGVHVDTRVHACSSKLFLKRKLKVEENTRCHTSAHRDTQSLFFEKGSPVAQASLKLTTV